MRQIDPLHRPGRLRTYATITMAAACLLVAGLAVAGSPATEIRIQSGSGNDLVFAPAEVAVPADTTIRVVFTNVSNQAHNLTFQTPITGGTSTIVEAGASDSVLIRTPSPGRYSYVCTIHLGMAGTLVVVPG